MNGQADTSILQRFNRVLAHIDAHTDEAVSLDQLSALAAYSKFHFHRQFSAFFGIEVNCYVQVVKLHRAAQRLAYRQNLSVLDIALESGFGSAEAFTRAFKRVFDMTPSEFRKQPGWDHWFGISQTINRVRNTAMPANYNIEDVSIVDFPETRIALIEHQGSPKQIGQTIRRFIDWRKANHLPPSKSKTYNLFYTSPDIDAAEFRLGIGATTESVITKNPQNVVSATIPANKCACLKIKGGDIALEQAALMLYRDWLAAKGEEPGDFPLFAERLTLSPDVPENEVELILYLPLK